MTGPCIAGIAYAFPAASRSVRQLEAEGQLQSTAQLMEAFGFGSVYVAVDESPYDLALRATRQLLEERDVDPETIDLVIYGGIPALAFSRAQDGCDAREALQTTARFRYPATRLQYDLGLIHASAFGLDQLACTTLFSAIRIASALGKTEGLERVLCVSADFFPAEAGREAIFNCTSDGACAVLIERSGERNRIVGQAHVTKGYYWDADALKNEIVASYFPTSKYAIERALADAGWEPCDVDWVVPHNVSRRSWNLLLGLVQLPRASLWADNIARHGHTLAGDNFINLRDALACGAIEPGAKVLLFSYGFGAHWTALALEA